MTLQNSELLEKIRQQFDSSPYPRMPLELSPKNDANALYLHNFITPFYLRNQQLIKPEKISILDVGCGSGYTTLTLAEANPGASIVGIDLSAKSIELARERLRFHGFTDVQFQVLSIDDVGRLGRKFDYINCDEVLYLMPDLVETLKALKSVLKPKGVLRGNLHSLYQRQNYFRAQELFTAMGLMQGNPEQTEIGIVLDTMRALGDTVPLKQQTWNPKQSVERPQEYVLMNYLFQGDQGYTIGDLFEALRGAELEFICMTNQRSWDLTKLFQDPQNLPLFWKMSLPQLSMEDRLQLFELLAPVHRLLDFWCGQVGQTQSWQVPSEWQPKQWEAVQITLHPQLQTEKVKAAVVEAIRQQRAFDVSSYLAAAAPAQVHTVLSPYLAACLLPLWEVSQSFGGLVERALKIRACDPVTLEPVERSQVEQELRQALINLEMYLYVLLTQR
ncbi:methyltransferase domain-containing protein [Phormidium tenue FACHB-886]|nr:methyltransferase domain-containing protein [Phormidium tenue FACHB-886]